MRRICSAVDHFQQNIFYLLEMMNLQENILKSGKPADDVQVWKNKTSWSEP